jgi:hypothetical protein
VCVRYLMPVGRAHVCVRVCVGDVVVWWCGVTGGGGYIRCYALGREGVQLLPVAVAGVC